MEEIIIRKAQKEDLKYVAEVNVITWKKAYKGIIKQDFLDNISIEKRYENILKHRNDENSSELIVAEINGEIAGFCRYMEGNDYSDEYKDVECEIKALYVKPQYKRKGIGKKLINYAKMEFKEKRLEKMILWCLKENYPSRAFYEKMGGTLCGEKATEIGGKEYKEVGYIYNVQE